MSSSLHVTGLWRAIDSVAGGANPGFQFTGMPVPDPDGRGYELTVATLQQVAGSVEWMIDPATGRPYPYAEAGIAALRQAFAHTGLSGDDQVIGSDGGDHLVTGAGNDVIYARPGDDDVDGEDGDDTIYGQEGNDVLRGGGGNDAINGGGGFDTAVFSGLRHQHGITGDMAQRAVASPATGMDTLVDVERLRFADGELVFDDAHSSGRFIVDEAAAQVARLYQAAVDRLPDAAGLVYWLDDVGGGRHALGEVADLFVGSREFLATYGALSDADYVSRIYRNVLDRTPADGEVGFWTGYLGDGTHDRGDLLLAFSDSAEFSALVAGSIDSGILFL